MRIKEIFYAGLGAMILGGCAGSEAPPVTTYVMKVPSFSPVTFSPNKEKVLKVAFPESLRENISDKMLYSYSDEDRGVYLNSRWANNIGKMLQGVMIETLEKSGAFKAVLPYSSTATEDLRIETYIYDISHHIRGNRSYAVLSVEVSLIDTYTGKLLKTKRFTYEEPTPTVDAKGYVEATNRILIRYNRDLLRFLGV